MNRPTNGARFQARPPMNGRTGARGIAPGRGAPPMRGGPPPRRLPPGRGPPMMAGGGRTQIRPLTQGGPAPQQNAAGRSQIMPGRVPSLSHNMMRHQGRPPPPPPPPPVRGRGPPPPPPRRPSVPPHTMPMNQPLGRGAPPFIPGRSSHMGRAIPQHPPQQPPTPHIPQQQHGPGFSRHSQQLPLPRSAGIPHPQPMQRAPGAQHAMHNIQPPTAPPRITLNHALAPAAPPVDPRQVHRRSSVPVVPAADPRTAQATVTAAPVTTTSMHVNTPAYSKEQIDQAWTEYTPANGGTKYYYNAITKTSTYDKPEPLKIRDAASAERAAPPSKTNQTWREYTDTSTGKKYYSNGVSTTWEKPASLNVDESRQPEEESSEPPRKKKKIVKKETEFGSKEESVAAFKGLLLAKEITPTMKWNEVIKLCSSDPRWQACEDVLTVGERKQSLAEYQTKRANDLRAIERQEKARAKGAFIQLLTETLPSVTGFSAWTSRFQDVRDSLTRDDRFHAVATETTRESLFLDFCEEFKKREERKKRNKKKEAKDAFLSFLAEMEEEGSLSFASTWNSFVSSLSNDQKADSRFTTSSFMSDSDRQLYFADFVIELQTAEDDKRSRIHGARRRAEKAQRESYEEALRELAADDKIVLSSRWRAVEEIITALPSHGPVYDQDREAPREIFEDYVSYWNETYRRERSFLCELVYPKTNKQLVVTAETSYEEFTKALLEAAADSEIYSQTRRIIHRTEPVSSARLYWRELVLKAKGLNGAIATRRGSVSRRGRGDDSSSEEDEGEIVEEGEVEAKA